MKKADHESDLVWKALADPTRRLILDELAERPRTTGEIVGHFDGLCRTAVMKHLDILVRSQLVLVRRQGRQRWNYLNPLPLQRVCDRWVSKHVRQLSSSLSRLKDFVEQSSDDTEQQSLKQKKEG